MSARPRTDGWSSPQIVLAIVLAILTAQGAYERFNGQLRERVVVLEHQVSDLRAEVRELRGGNHGGSR